jgi:hypothetical protein
MANRLRNSAEMHLLLANQRPVIYRSGIAKQERTKQKYCLGDYQGRYVDDIDADKPRNEITHEIKTAPLQGIRETSAYQETAQHKKYDNGLALQTGDEIKQFQE